MKFVELATQSFRVPKAINGTVNPQHNLEVMLNAGWRLYDDPPAVAEGYERGEITWTQDPNDPERAIPQYTDTLIQDRLDAEATAAAQAAAAEFAANAERFTYQNTYLLLCDALTGNTDHTKLGFDQVAALLIAMRQASDPNYDKSRDALTLLDSALKRMGGLNWWDDCEWTSESTIEAQSQGFYNQLMG